MLLFQGFTRPHHERRELTHAAAPAWLTAHPATRPQKEGEHFLLLSLAERCLALLHQHPVCCKGG